MKKISKVVGGLLLIAGISACSSSDRSLQLSLDPFSSSSVYVLAKASDIKGYVTVPNPNATIFNYTITGNLAGCTVSTVDSTGDFGAFTPNNSSGTTYAGIIWVDCGNLAAGTYSGTVTMTTRSGGYNYSGSIPVTITF
ncbi:hypothetical protein B4919_06995 [Francisella tularensis subsp. novicida]|uniref:hypothetical protein n=1 Tax=Francisella tularensis TaxID=263 RepID=UPI000CE29906|nr:hypothetical protein [Francisella tularensis]AVC44544.1 hypothetical protein B4919_06995 [Francisella tularensis subsp. novicida]